MASGHDGPVKKEAHHHRHRVRALRQGVRALATAPCVTCTQQQRHRRQRSFYRLPQRESYQSSPTESPSLRDAPCSSRRPPQHLTSPSRVPGGARPRLMYPWHTMEAGSKANYGKRRKNSWTSEKETRLIGLYQKYRLLWDHRHPDYYKRDQRENAMRAIADGMDNEFDVVNVKDKIKTLRDYFVKEMKKEEGSRMSACAYSSRWEHYKCWEFLRGAVHAEATPQPAMLHPEVKREAPDDYPEFPSYDCESDMILPTTPDSISEEDGLGSPRKRFARHHSSTSSRSPLKHLALGSESTVLSRDPVVPAYLNGFRTACPRPQPAKRLRQLTVPDRTPLRQSDRIVNGGQSYETNCLLNIASHLGATDVAGNADTKNCVGPNASSAKVALSAASDLSDGETLFTQQVASELREMDKYQRDLAKVRIQQVLFDVKYMSQARNVGSSEELQRTQATPVETMSQVAQRSASIPVFAGASNSGDGPLLSKGTRHPAFHRAVSSV